MGNGTRKLMACPFEFKQHGKSGLPVSSLLPHTAQHVDDLCLIRSMQHDTIIHTPGQYMLTTGTIVGDRPSLGAWSVYGLGSDNKDLPGFVLLGDAPRPAYGRRPDAALAHGHYVGLAEVVDDNRVIRHGCAVECTTCPVPSKATISLLPQRDRLAGEASDAVVMQPTTRPGSIDGHPPLQPP